jgi:hypothetical protein
MPNLTNKKRKRVREQRTKQLVLELEALLPEVFVLVHVDLRGRPGFGVGRREGERDHDRLRGVHACASQKGAPIVRETKRNSQKQRGIDTKREREEREKEQRQR